MTITGQLYYNYITIGLLYYNWKDASDQCFQYSQYSQWYSQELPCTGPRACSDAVLGFPSLSLPPSLCFCPSLSLSDPPAHCLSPPPLPPVFQLETYLCEPQRLETRRLRSFSSPADATLSSFSSTCISSGSASPLAPGLQVWRLVSQSLSWYWSDWVLVDKLCLFSWLFKCEKCMLRPHVSQPDFLFASHCWHLWESSLSGGHRGQKPLEGRAVHQNITNIFLASQWQMAGGSVGLVHLQIWIHIRTEQLASAQPYERY